MNNRETVYRMMLLDALADLAEARTEARWHHKRKNYKKWSRLMRDCKLLKQNLAVVAFRLHKALYLSGKTRIAPTRPNGL